MAVALPVMAWALSSPGCLNDFIGKGTAGRLRVRPRPAGGSLTKEGVAGSAAISVFGGLFVLSGKVCRDKKRDKNQPREPAGPPINSSGWMRLLLNETKCSEAA